MRDNYTAPCTRGREFAWNARRARPMGISVSVDIWPARASPRQKKALQKRRQKLGVSAGDISGLKLSRRSKHVLPAWFCVPCLTDWMVGWLVGWLAGWLVGRSAGRSVGSLTGARMALRSIGVLALVNRPGAISGTR